MVRTAKEKPKTSRPNTSIVARAQSRIDKAKTVEALFDLEEKFLFDSSIDEPTKLAIQKPLVAALEKKLKEYKGKEAHPAIVWRLEYFTKGIKGLAEFEGTMLEDGVAHIEKTMQFSYMPKPLKTQLARLLRPERRRAEKAAKIREKAQKKGARVDIHAEGDTPHEVIPPPVIPRDDAPQLYGFHADEIVRKLKGSIEPEHRALADDLAKMKGPIAILAAAAADRRAARFLFEAAPMKTFYIKRFLSDTEFHWTARIAFLGILPSVGHDYRLHFVLDPRPHFNTITSLELKRRDIEREPSLLGEFDSERTADVEKEIADELDGFEKLKQDCPDIILDLETQGSEYTDKGYTVIKFKISPQSVADLNERRENMKKYKVMLLDITQP